MDEGKINAPERALEPQEKTREEEGPVKFEKPPKKPGSVSRFFNQFGIGKYWEKMNDYFEYEEKMEAATAEKEAKKETAEAMGIAGEEAVGAIEEKGAEIPQQLNEAAARAGAAGPEAASIVAEAEAREAQVEAEAEVAAAEMKKGAEALVAEPEAKAPAAEQAEVEDVEIIEQKPLLEEVAEQTKMKYERVSMQEVNDGIKALEDQMRTQDARHEEIEQGLKSGKLFKSDKLRAEQENMEEMRALIKAERDALLRVKKEKMKKEKEPMVQAEEFEAIAKEHEAKKESEKEIPVYLAEEGIPSAEEIIEKHEVGREMEKAKVEPLALKKMKKKEEKPAVEELEELKQLKLEEEFFEAGEKGSKEVLDRMKKSLLEKRAAYAAQKAARDLSPQDKKALKERIAKTKKSAKVIKEEPLEEIKPEKVVELKKPAKKKAAKRRAA